MLPLQHRVCVVNPDGDIVDQKWIEHSGQSLAELVTWLRSKTSASPNTVHLTNHHSLGKIDSTRALPFARAQRVVAHLTLHAARVDPVATRHNSLFKNLVQDRLVKGFSLPRGE